MAVRMDAVDFWQLLDNRVEAARRDECRAVLDYLQTRDNLPPEVAEFLKEERANLTTLPAPHREFRWL